ncbi:MAG TPA: hypothetical protein VGV88_10935 [Candidatus Dormibacteraeota bacterium]|nr:hypothetical protein [Candidatus Dormibacteraeota bacterium]
MSVDAQDIALILQALDDAAFFRESRASAMERVARKGRRGTSETPVGESDKQKARDYNALSRRLRQRPAR